MFARFLFGGAAAALLAAALVPGALVRSPAAVGAAPLAGAAPPARQANFQPTRFSVVVKGSGPDVILIPGLTASRDIWNGTVAAVPGYRYHLIQVNGFAGSKAGGNARGEVVAPLAQEIARYIAAKGLGRPAIVGHSMGGTMAMMIGARQPDRVGKVMVVDMLPEAASLFGGTAAGLRPLADSLRDIAATEDGRRLVQSVIGMFGNPAPADRASDSDVVARATHELALTDLTPELARIKAPLTVLYASPSAESRARVDRTYESAYARKRGAKLVRVDDSGHMIMYDRPAKFRSELKAFLAK